MRSELFRDGPIPRLQQFYVYAAGSVAEFMRVLRDGLAAQSSPYVNDEFSEQAWREELARSLSDDELSDPLLHGHAAGWCSKRLEDVARVVTERSGSVPLRDRRSRWSAGCADLVRKASQELTRAPDLKYLVFALGGATVFKGLQRDGQVEIDPSKPVENDALEMSRGAIFDGDNERAQVTARVADELARPLDLWIVKRRPMRLASLGAGMSLWWKDGLHWSYQLDASVRLPYEVGRLEATYTNALNDSLPGNGFDVVATLWLHPWCAWSHRSRDAASFCRFIIAAPTVAWEFRERSLVFGLAMAFSVTEGRVGVQEYTSWRFARNPSSGQSVGGSLAF